MHIAFIGIDLGKTTFHLPTKTALFAFEGPVI